MSSDEDSSSSETSDESGPSCSRPSTSLMRQRIDTSSKEKSINSAISASKDPFVHLSTLYEGHKRTIYGVAFSPYLTETPYFATVGDNRVIVYAIPKESSSVQLMRAFHDSSKKEAFFAVCWMYDTINNAHLVAVGGSRGIISIIDVSSGVLINALRLSASFLQSLIGHGDAVNDIRVCPNDSTLIASASKDFTARIWNIHNSACLAILGGVEGHIDQVLSVDFDATGSYLASSSMDHTAKLWYIGEGSGVDRLIEQCKSDLKLVDSPVEIHYPRCSTRDVHTNYVDSVRIFHRLIFSKSTENEIVLWKFGDFDDSINGQGNQLKTDSCVIHFRHLKLPHTNMWYIKFEIDPLERYVACGNQIGEIHIWNLNKNRLPTSKSDFVIRSKDVSCTIRQIAFSPCGKHMIAVADDASVSRFMSTQ